MIYLKRTNPVDAKPGDLMFIEGANSEYFGLYICINMHGGTIGNNWHPAKCFNRKEYEAIGEIVDGKPTPELIARFAQEARESGKRFDFGGWTYVSGKNGMCSVGPIGVKGYPERYCLTFTLPGDPMKIRTVCFSVGKDLTFAESERERLISWLEEA